MSFYERYQLIDLSREGAVKTFAARQNSTRRDVSVHLLVGGRQAHGPLLDSLKALPDWMKAEILDMGEHEGTTFVVTAPWLRRESFEEWVESAAKPNIQEDKFARAGSWRVPTAEFRGKSADAPTVGPGEFTRIFQQAPGATPPLPEPEPPMPNPHPEPEPSRPDPAPVVNEGPSVFTSMFEAERRVDAAGNASPPKPYPSLAPEETSTAELPVFDVFRKPASDIRSSEAKTSSDAAPDKFSLAFQGGAAPVTAEVPLAPARSEAPAGSVAGGEPGEFTRMFQTPASPAPAGPGPGEFTRMFQTPAALAVPEPAPPAQASPAPASPAPGEFTRMFQTPTAPAVPEPARPAPAPPAPGEFTRIFQPPPAPAAAPPPPPPAGGEFTRMFQTSRPAPAPASPPAPMPQSAPGEFTKFFQAPPAPSPEAHPAFRDPFGGQASSSPSAGPGGEFTRMFGAPVIPPAAGEAPPPPPPQPTGGGEYTRMFSAVVPPPPAAAPPQPAQPATPQPQPAGPGEFTRMFTAPAPQSTIGPPQAASPAPAQQSQSKPAAKKAGYLPLFLILGVLLLIAIGLLLFAALRK